MDIQGKIAEGKSVGYKKWATKFNLKEMSKTLLFLQEQKISSAEELQKLSRVKELDAEFAELLTKKKAAYPDYRKARNEMQELVRAQKNVERFFAEEKDTTEITQTR
mgnify:CR=1 FL=1